MLETTLGSNIIFLSSEDQINFANEFVDALPWKSFGRKNVGYLFAIARGAKIIWDFDDDNFLKFWLDGAAVDESLDINSFVNINGKYMSPPCQFYNNGFIYSKPKFYQLGISSEH